MLGNEALKNTKGIEKSNVIMDYLNHEWLEGLSNHDLLANCIS